jgi:hypothetical protein
MSRVLRVAVCSRVTLFETETATDWAAASGTLMTPGQTSLTEGRVPKVVSGGLAGRSILDWDQRATKLGCGKRHVGCGFNGDRKKELGTNWNCLVIAEIKNFLWHPEQ